MRNYTNELSLCKSGRNPNVTNKMTTRSCITIMARCGSQVCFVDTRPNRPESYKLRLGGPGLSRPKPGVDQGILLSLTRGLSTLRV